MVGICIMAAVVVGSGVQGLPADNRNSAADQFDKKTDFAIAQIVVDEIKGHLEADRRAYHRAVEALAGTDECKIELNDCPSRNKSYWGVCMTDDKRDLSCDMRFSTICFVKKRRLGLKNDLFLVTQWQDAPKSHLTPHMNATGCHHDCS